MKNKSIMRKLVAVVAAATMVLGMTMPASAAGLPAPPTTNDGTLTVHKKATPVAPTKLNPSGEALSATDEAALGVGLNGAGFSLYRVDIYGTAHNAADTIASVTPNYNAVDASKMDGITVVWNDSMAAPATYTETVDTTAAGVQQSSNLVSTETTANDGAQDGIAKWTGLNTATGEKLSYYMLVESTPVAGYERATDSIITMPITNAAGTGWNKDIHVYPKDVDQSTVSKVITGTVKDYYKPGDTITFDITAKIDNTNYSPAGTVASANDLRTGAGSPYTYGTMSISDFPVGLDNVSYTSVEFVDNTGAYVAATVGATQGGGTDFYTTAAGALTAGEAFRLNLDEAGIDNAITNNYVAIVVHVTSQVNYATTSGTQNNAKVDINGATASTERAVPTIKIQIDKKDHDTSLKVHGAEFIVTTTATNPSTNNYADAIKDPAYAGTPSPTDGSDCLVLKTDSMLVAGVATDGCAYISSLPYTGAAVTYYLWEIKAGQSFIAAGDGSTVTGGVLTPATPTAQAYQLKTTSTAVSFAAGLTADTVQIVAIDNYKQGSAIDPQGPQFSLPLTGGTGTVIFTIVGILVIIAAAVLYGRRRRKINL